MEPSAENVPASDGMLYERAQHGDREAIAQLLERHLPGLEAYVRLKAGRAVRAHEETRDIVQSVCRELLGGLERFEFRGEGPFRHWLYTAALRKIVARDAYWRAQRRDAGRNVDAEPDLAGDRAVLGHYGAFASPSQVALAREELERIEAAFDRLDEPQRELILLARVAGLSRREIAEQLGKSEEAVRVSLHRALARLSALLEPPEDGSGN